MLKLRPPTWEQFARGSRFAIGAALAIYGTTVTAVQAPASLPYILVAATALLGVSFTLPAERKKKDESDPAP